MSFAIVNHDHGPAVDQHPARCTCGTGYGCDTHGPQPRERAVMCLCGRETWRVDGRCEHCAISAARHTHPAGSGRVA